MSLSHKLGRTPVYDAAFKIKVAREYLTSNLGYGRLAEKYDLPSLSTARFFVKWYKTNYPEPEPGSDPDTAPVIIPAQSNPPDELTRKELALARLKIAGLEMMIQTASKELGVDITKKAGTKPSSK